ncbi:hypothetical protein B0H19DRAFT_473713 [Mycena capillaripes]|nr:hypothetical protein B0H19DRAFT_473713 [Mycena capillaripes]
MGTTHNVMYLLIPLYNLFPCIAHCGCLGLSMGRRPHASLGLLELCSVWAVSGRLLLKTRSPTAYRDWTLAFHPVRFAAPPLLRRVVDLANRPRSGPSLCTPLSYIQESIYILYTFPFLYTAAEGRLSHLSISHTRDIPDSSLIGPIVRPP